MLILALIAAVFVYFGTTLEISTDDNRIFWRIAGLFPLSRAGMCIIPKAGLDSYECGQLGDLVRRINENK